MSNCNFTRLKTSSCRPGNMLNVASLMRFCTPAVHLVCTGSLNHSCVYLPALLICFFLSSQVGLAHIFNDAKTRASSGGIKKRKQPQKHWFGCIKSVLEVTLRMQGSCSKWDYDMILMFVQYSKNKTAQQNKIRVWL